MSKICLSPSARGLKFYMNMLYYEGLKHDFQFLSFIFAMGFSGQNSLFTYLQNVEN
jgi:hypothetical protein